MRSHHIPKLLTIASVVTSLAVYGVLYVRLAARSSGRARSAGGFFHYRQVAADWQAYLFIPAVFVESWCIRINPKAFLPHPSWAELPQRLILQSPTRKFGVHASWKQFSTD